MSDTGLQNERFELPINSAIFTSHLVCMLMYTNMIEMQYKYKKYCCTNIKDMDDENELIQRHKQIHHWYKLIIERLSSMAILDCYPIHLETPIIRRRISV